MKNFCLWVKSNETFHEPWLEYGWTSCQVSSKLVVRFQRYIVAIYRRTFIYYNKDISTLIQLIYQNNMKIKFKKRDMLCDYIKKILRNKGIKNS